ncbi:Lsr2 family DNA-binding protein [Streptomyces sp. NPDC002845]
MRAWARDRGINVPSRGKLRQEVWDAWHTAHAEHHTAAPA